jgi:transposase-like protein
MLRTQLLTITQSGFRESELSWTELLLDLKHSGLKTAPELAIGDGALGFWKALTKVYHNTRWQRCWVHKTANVLNKLPKSLQAKAKEKLHQIWMAPDNAVEVLGRYVAWMWHCGADCPRSARRIDHTQVWRKISNHSRKSFNEEILFMLQMNSQSVLLSFY